LPKAGEPTSTYKSFIVGRKQRGFLFNNHGIVGYFLNGRGIGGILAGYWLDTGDQRNGIDDITGFFGR
jgi:hypothetical protein